MGKYERLIQQIISGRADANIAFDNLCNLLLRCGFAMRISGSHHIFRKAGIEEKPNLQKDGNKAKPYQVKQVRQIILKYKLGEEVKIDG
ncbi:toxin HicA [Candidatus Desantisbacteria bacterium CG_4_9_14_3_um_filter_40_11]|uniref:Toxin HicA n=3 Tax=unclassified Candidatus Desantisiibacteriota TaxID=3106372 RepID=A0A2M7J9B0_9BACT|nr:MAG: toxin HicA [Candidatus Desantisbacteria bacterium CG_4_8_14_3_um_filter_40_12]PIY19467.1 MAG: toxin HicA [Candidatus Desantisbacteria bacterium CG_4_10_14_3_um_filter_40_18]PJB30233.1 MAG: toxin HicA [Candidatus Desantisbacteria bacterium CG_4_9_14_3_um_filter_40_11]